MWRLQFDPKVDWYIVKGQNSNVYDGKKCGKAPLLLQVPSLRVLPLLLSHLTSSLSHEIVWSVSELLQQRSWKLLETQQYCCLMGASGWSDFRSTKFNIRDTAARFGEILLSCGFCNAGNTWCWEGKISRHKWPSLFWQDVQKHRLNAQPIW